MINDILKATSLAKAELTKLKEIKKEDLTTGIVETVLRKAILYKLMIESDEDNLRNLVVLSIKSADKRVAGLSEEAIRQQITKYDCHQTSLVVQKKALLLIFIEKELDIHLSDDEAVEVRTVSELGRIVAGKMK